MSVFQIHWAQGILHGQKKCQRLINYDNFCNKESNILDSIRGFPHQNDDNNVKASLLLKRTFPPYWFQSCKYKTKTVFAYFHLEIHTIPHCREHIALSRNIIIFSATNVLFKLKLLPRVLQLPVIKDIIFSSLTSSWNTLNLPINLGMQLRDQIIKNVFGFQAFQGNFSAHQDSLKTLLDQLDNSRSLLCFCCSNLPDSYWENYLWKQMLEYNKILYLPVYGLDFKIYLFLTL